MFTVILNAWDLRRLEFLPPVRLQIPSMCRAVVTARIESKISSRVLPAYLGANRCLIRRSRRPQSCHPMQRSAWWHYINCFTAEGEMAEASPSIKHTVCRSTNGTIHPLAYEILLKILNVNTGSLRVWEVPRSALGGDGRLLPPKHQLWTNVSSLHNVVISRQ